MAVSWRPPMRLQLTVAFCLFAASSEALDVRTSFLIRQLERASDPRSRVQAAIMLGSREDAVAVPFLCKALGDVDESVRLAVVKALGQLPTPESIGCLRKANDSAASVRRAIEKTLAAPKPQLSVYVRVDPLVDRTDSPNPAVGQALETQFREALEQLGATLASSHETKSQALAFEKATNLRGYAILPELKSIPGGLQLTLICSSYPDRALLGEVNVRATGAAPEHLIRALVPQAITEAAQTFDWSQ